MKMNMLLLYASESWALLCVFRLHFLPWQPQGDVATAVEQQPFPPIAYTLWIAKKGINTPCSCHLVFPLSSFSLTGLSSKSNALAAAHIQQWIENGHRLWLGKIDDVKSDAIRYVQEVINSGKWWQIVDGTWDEYHQERADRTMENVNRDNSIKRGKGRGLS